MPHAHLVTTTTHKSLRGPRGGLVLATEEYAPIGRPGLPDGARRSARPRDGGQGRRPGRGPEPSRSRRTPRPSPTTPSRWPTGCCGAGAKLVTGGTDNHLVLIDVSSFGLTGRQAESALLDAGIVTNRNAVPCDPNGAWYTSGVRDRHPGPDHPRLRRRRVRPGRRTDRQRAAEHHAGHRLQRQAGQGEVRPGRRRRRPYEGGLGGAPRRYIRYTPDSSCNPGRPPRTTWHRRP